MRLPRLCGDHGTYRCHVGEYHTTLLTSGAPGVLVIWGERLFIFMELGSTGNYFRGAREQAHNFGSLGSLAKKPKKNNKENLHFV